MVVMVVVSIAQSIPVQHYLLLLLLLMLWLLLWLWERLRLLLLLLRWVIWTNRMQWLTVLLKGRMGHHTVINRQGRSMAKTGRHRRRFETSQAQTR